MKLPIMTTIIIASILLLQSCTYREDKLRISQLTKQVETLKKENKELKKPKRTRVINTVIISNKNNKEKEDQEINLPLSQRDAAQFKNTVNTNFIMKQEEYLI